MLESHDGRPGAPCCAAASPASRRAGGSSFFLLLGGGLFRLPFSSHVLLRGPHIIKFGLDLWADLKLRTGRPVVIAASAGKADHGEPHHTSGEHVVNKPPELQRFPPSWVINVCISTRI